MRVTFDSDMEFPVKINTKLNQVTQNLSFLKIAESEDNSEHMEITGENGGGKSARDKITTHFSSLEITDSPKNSCYDDAEINFPNEYYVGQTKLEKIPEGMNFLNLNDTHKSIEEMNGSRSKINYKNDDSVNGSEYFSAFEWSGVSENNLKKSSPLQLNPQRLKDEMPNGKENSDSKNNKEREVKFQKIFEENEDSSFIGCNFDNLVANTISNMNKGKFEETTSYEDIHIITSDESPCNSSIFNKNKSSKKSKTKSIKPKNKPKGHNHLDSSDSSESSEEMVKKNTSASFKNIMTNNKSCIITGCNMAPIKVKTIKGDLNIGLTEKHVLRGVRSSRNSLKKHLEKKQ